MCERYDHIIILFSIAGKLWFSVIADPRYQPTLNFGFPHDTRCGVNPLLAFEQQLPPRGDGFTHNTQSTNDRLGKITENVMNNFDKEISLPEIASMANMAVTTFCNFFKEQYRTTFVEYLNSVRIGHACKLLSEKDQTIVEVAYECGFNNLANFNRQFKKYKKMTPTQYRRTVNLSEAA